MSESKPMTERQRYWSAHLQACEASGQTLKAYADVQGLDAQSLYRAKSALRARAMCMQATHTVSKTAATFVRVDTSESKSPDGVCSVRLRNGITVDIRCSASQWSSLLAAIAQLP